MTVSFLYCFRCHRCVSTGFEPVPTDTPDKGIIVRALVLCPECFDKEFSRGKHGQRIDKTASK